MTYDALCLQGKSIGLSAMQIAEFLRIPNVLTAEGGVPVRWWRDRNGVRRVKSCSRDPPEIRKDKSRASRGK